MFKLNRNGRYNIAFPVMKTFYFRGKAERVSALRIRFALNLSNTWRCDASSRDADESAPRDEKGSGAQSGDLPYPEERSRSVARKYKSSSLDSKAKRRRDLFYTRVKQKTKKPGGRGTASEVLGASSIARVNLHAWTKGRTVASAKLAARRRVESITYNFN